MSVRSLPMKGGKGLGHDGFDTFAPQAGHVYDITDTVTDREHWAHNGGTRVGSCCHNFQTLMSNQQDKKSSEKLLCIFFTPFLSAGPVTLPWFTSPVTLESRRGQ